MEELGPPGKGVGGFLGRGAGLGREKVTGPVRFGVSVAEQSVGGLGTRLWLSAASFLLGEPGELGPVMGTSGGQRPLL